MKKPIWVALVAITTIVGSAPAMSQSNQGAAEQFKSAGNNISAAAQGIGAGIKEGAIQAWEAVKAGAAAAADKLSGQHTPAVSQSRSTDSQ